MLDREALAEVAQFVASFAPEAVPRPTMFRLINKKAPAIRQKTFDALVAALESRATNKSEAAISRLHYAALGADGIEISRAYSGWLSSHVVHFFTLGAPYLVRREDGRGLRPLGDDEGEAGHDLILGTLPTGGPSALARDYYDLNAAIYDSAAGELLSEFETWIAANGHGDALDNPYLYDLAYRRILRPLLESPLSGYVERHWRELSDEELRRFVAAGITREKIMLSRSPESRRIQAVLAGELPPTR